MRPISVRWAVMLLTLAASLSCERRSSAERLPSGVDRKSQPALLSQRIGAAEVTIVYNRPVARGRALFGALVPYGEVWNPGADEATRVELNQDLQVEGQRLPAGKYSIWAVPDPREWILIFSNAWDVPHTPYPEGKDALRIRARPQPASHVETLAFYFPVVEADSAILNLHWGETVVPLRLRVR